MLSDQPKLFIIAGANGIGKTTSFFTDLPIDCPVINADEISKQIKEKVANNANIQDIANREAIHQMNIYLSKKQTFAFETNLADFETWKFIEKIGFLGYYVEMSFYSTDDVQICINRVKQRVLEGGHDVREDIIIQRYQAGIQLLKANFKIPDKLILIDNSSLTFSCATFSKGVLIQKAQELPKWTLQIISNLEDSNSKNIDLTIEQIRENYKNIK